MQIHILMFDDRIERASTDALKICDLADAMNGGKDMFGPYSVVSVELEDASQLPLKQTDNETKGGKSESYDYDNLHVEIDNAVAELNLDVWEALEVWHTGIEKIDIVFEMGKKWIKKSSIRHIDHVARIFVSELQDRGEYEKADELYKFYDG